MGGFPAEVLRLSLIQGARTRLGMRVDALRLVAGLNVPKATKSDRLRDLERSLSESDRSKVVSSITRLDDSVGLSLQELSQPSDASKTRQSEPSIPTWLPNPEEMVVLMMEHVGQDGIGFMQADFLDASRGDPLLTEFGIQYLQRTKTEDASELLRQSIVVLLVSGFEDFLAAMMRAHVRTSSSGPPIPTKTTSPSFWKRANVLPTS